MVQKFIGVRASVNNKPVQVGAMSKAQKGFQRVKVFSSTAPEKKLRKTSRCLKQLKGDSFCFSNTHSVAKLQKLGRNFLSKRNSRILVSSGNVCYARNLFGSLPWANRGNINFYRTFGRTILVPSSVSKCFWSKH